MTYERDLSFRSSSLADWEEYKTERAAICEYLGGLSRKAADRAALIMAGPPPRDWQQQGLLDKRPGEWTMKCRKCSAEAVANAGRCQMHLDEHRAWMRRHREQRRALRRVPVTSSLAVTPLVALYLDARKLVMGKLWQCSIATTPHLQRRVSETYQRILRARGVKVTGVNEPPPGWTREEDIREEHIALGEHLAMRRIA